MISDTLCDTLCVILCDTLCDVLCDTLCDTLSDTQHANELSQLFPSSIRRSQSIRKMLFRVSTLVAVLMAIAATSHVEADMDVSRSLKKGKGSKKSNVPVAVPSAPVATPPPTEVISSVVVFVCADDCGATAAEITDPSFQDGIGPGD